MRTPYSSFQNVVHATQFLRDAVKSLVSMFVCERRISTDDRDLSRQLTFERTGHLFRNAVRQGFRCGVTRKVLEWEDHHYAIVFNVIRDRMLIPHGDENRNGGNQEQCRGRHDASPCALSKHCVRNSQKPWRSAARQAGDWQQCRVHRVFASRKISSGREIDPGHRVYEAVPHSLDCFDESRKLRGISKDATQTTQSCLNI